MTIDELEKSIAEATFDNRNQSETQAYLGNATNEELLEELKVRIETHWDLNYKTTIKDEDYIPSAPLKENI